MEIDWAGTHLTSFSQTLKQKGELWRSQCGKSGLRTEPGVSSTTMVWGAGIPVGFAEGGFAVRANWCVCWKQPSRFHVQLFIWDSKGTASDNPTSNAILAHCAHDWSLKNRLLSHNFSACFIGEPKDDISWAFFHPSYGAYHFFN